MTLKLPSANGPVWDRVHATAAGEDLATRLTWKELNASLWLEGEVYRDLPFGTGPQPIFDWISRPRGQRFACDEVSAVAFRQQPSNGLRVGRIQLPAFDS